MKSLLLSFLVCTIALFPGYTQAQEKRASPMATTENDVAKVVYSRPYKKNRVIFGKLVPYGEVWRTGANEATEITFKRDAVFGGKKIKKGTYTLFTIPKIQSWTVILNSQLKQWGSFAYEENKAKDVLKVDVIPKKTKSTVEQFTMTMAKNMLVMEWENTRVEVPVKAQ